MNALAKVLIVDDDAVVGLSFDRVLSQKGYVVSIASNGKEALEKFSGEKHDVVFTDIKMPGMDGIEVAQRIKAESPSTNVVVITGYGTAENEEAAAAIGVTEFLRKPLLPETIEDVMEKITYRQVAEVVTVKKEEVQETSTPVSVGRAIKNIALFFAAPFIGLVYFIFFPFVGLGMLAWAGFQALTSRPTLEE